MSGPTVEELADEIAHARVLARRGEAPEGDWPRDEGDPRRVAYRGELWRQVARETWVLQRGATAPAFDGPRPEDHAASAAIARALHLLRLEAEPRHVARRLAALARSPEAVAAAVEVAKSDEAGP